MERIETPKSIDEQSEEASVLAVQMHHLFQGHTMGVVAAAFGSVTAMVFRDDPISMVGFLKDLNDATFSARVAELEDEQDELSIITAGVVAPDQQEPTVREDVDARKALAAMLGIPESSIVFLN